MSATAPVSVCGLGATLGEGPAWVARDAALWFVDIKAKRIHRFEPDNALLRCWNAPAQPGWVLPANDGSLIAGLQTGLHRFDPEDGSFVPLLAPEPALPGNRLNDATVDAGGRLWFGSMDDGEEAVSGRLYRFAGGAAADSGLPPVIITNGPAITSDGRMLYHTDTLGKAIWEVPLAEDGALGTPRLFATIEDGAGYPDGPTVDAEGCVWTGLFGGWGVRRYAPTGELLATVDFPVANVTKIAFGGDDLCTVYATTARKGLDDRALAEQPLAGDVFSFRVDVPGLPLAEIAV
jgi:sugar lactone lactonase YvrE